MKTDVHFDLDGTLWNSSPQVTMAWNTVLPSYPRAGKLLTEEVLSGYMGKTIQEIAPLFLPHLPFDEAMEIVLACCDREQTYLAAHGGTLYAGLEETLQALRAEGRRLFIVSNCQEGYLDAFFSYHGLRPFFDGWECSGRTGQGKGENIRSLCAEHGVENGVFIGDTDGDRKAAVFAGLPFIYAEYGFGTVPDSDGVLSDIRRLPALLARRFDG